MMTDSAASLRALEEELTGCYLRRRPLTAAQLGDPAWRQQLLPVVTSDATADLARQVSDIRGRLALIPAGELTAEDQLTLDMMTELSGYELGDLSAGPSRYVVTPLPEAGLTSQLILLLPQASIRDDADLGTFISACEQIPDVLADSLAELAAGRAAGYHPVGHLAGRAVEQIEQYLSSPLADDRFVRAARPAAGRPPALPPSASAPWSAPPSVPPSAATAMRSPPTCCRQRAAPIVRACPGCPAASRSTWPRCASTRLSTPPPARSATRASTSSSGSAAKSR